MTRAAPIITPASWADQRQGAGLFLGLLTLSLIICNIDRNIISVLLEPIRIEFGLRDWQLGVLSGLVFTLLYTVGGLFVSRLAERKDRVKILAVSMLLWSVATFVCGFAGSFIALLLARGAVGLAESGSQAPSHALIADRFPPQSRSWAMGIYASGTWIGITLALAVGGWIAQKYGWRLTLQIVAGPGVILAVLMLFLVQDPRSLSGNRQHRQSEGMGVALKKIVANPVLFHGILGGALATVSGASVMAFGPSFLVRSHGLTVAGAGLLFGIAKGSGAIIGILFGGWLASRLVAKGGASWNARLPAYSQLAAILFSVGFLLLPSIPLVVASGFVASFLSSIWLGPVFALVQGAAGENRRATAAAVLLMSYNIIGFGLGPLLAGTFSDLYKSSFGADALRVSLVSLLPFTAWAAFHFIAAARASARSEAERALSGPA